MKKAKRKLSNSRVSKPTARKRASESAARKRLSAAKKKVESRLRASKENLALSNENLTITNEELLMANEELRAVEEALRKRDRQLQEFNRKLQENNKELELLNRHLQAHSKSDQIIMQAKNGDELVYRACKNIVKCCGHKMVWIGYAENDENKSVRPVAYSGLEIGYLKTLGITWANTERGQGVTGTAIRTGKVSLCEDIDKDPRVRPWRKEALKRGYASCVGIPLIANRKAFGAITIYSSKVNGFTASELNILTDLANDMANGIVSMRARTERERAEKALRESEERFRRLFEQDLTGDFVSSGDGGILLCNPAFASIYGFRNVKEAIGTNLESLHIEPEEWKTLLVLLKKEKILKEYECRHRRRNGDIIHVLANIIGTFDKKGDLSQFNGYIFDITGRKEAEAAIVEAKRAVERERDLLQTTMNGAKKSHLVYLDRDFNFVRVNEAYAKTCGYKPEEMIGKNHFALYPDKENEAIFARVRDTGIPVEFHDKPFVFPDQPERGITYWDWTLIPVKGESRKVEGLIFSLVETTDRKQAEESLRQSERLLQDVIDGSTSPIFLKDRDGKFITINASLERMLGISRQELKGKTDYDIAPKEVADYWRSHDTKVITTGKGIQIEETADLKDGHHIFLANKFPLVNAEGQVYGVGAISHDITVRKRAEEVLRQSEERFRTLAEAVPGIVWTTTADGIPDYYNNRWYEYTGLAADVVGEAWQKTIHPDDFEQIKTAWAKSVKTGAAFKIQIRIRRADGHYHWYLSQAVPLHDAEGNTIKWFGTATDIEEQMRNQQELERFRDELEHKNEELESIIRIASHDLRSPLMNIKGFSGELSRDLSEVYDILATVPLPEDVNEKVEMVFNKYAKEAIGFIQTSADSINAMLKSLMQVAKAGTVPINIQNLNMNELLSKIAASIQLRLKETGGRFEVEELPGCRGDGEQLRQVFTNIVENAIKYRDPQRPLQIRIYGTSGEGMTTYCVEDNGKGIEPEYLDKIFELFARLEPETTKGEGLGLTIAKRIIERQGGKIWASSEEGKGSKFYVSLPY